MADEQPKQGGGGIRGFVVGVVEGAARPIRDYFLDTKGQLEKHDKKLDDLNQKLEQVLIRLGAMDEKIDSLRREIGQFRDEANHHFTEAKEDNNRRFAESTAHLDRRLDGIRDLITMSRVMQQR